MCMIIGSGAIMTGGLMVYHHEAQTPGEPQLPASRSESIKYLRLTLGVPANGVVNLPGIKHEWARISRGRKINHEKDSDVCSKH